MEILQGFVDAVVGIFEDSGLLTLNWQNYVMIGISTVSYTHLTLPTTPYV